MDMEEKGNFTGESLTSTTWAWGSRPTSAVTGHANIRLPRQEGMKWAFYLCGLPPPNP